MKFAPTPNFQFASVNNYQAIYGCLQDSFSLSYVGISQLNIIQFYRMESKLNKKKNFKYYRNSEFGKFFI